VYLNKNNTEYKNVALDEINYHDLDRTKLHGIICNLDRAKSIYRLNILLLDIDTAKRIEKSILDYTIYYVSYYLLGNTNLLDSVYNDRLNDICENLDPKSSINNNELKKMIINGKINPDEIGYMTPDELFPSKWKAIYDKLALRRDKIQNTATTNEYMCKRCGKRECIVKQEQTRSSDEPPTTFIICKNCKIIAYKF